jgi:hypothetical protein
MANIVAIAPEHRVTVGRCAHLTFCFIFIFVFCFGSGSVFGFDLFLVIAKNFYEF